MFKIKDIKEILNDMRIYYSDGELSKGKFTLVLGITEDKSGLEGFVYTWDLFEEDENIDGDGYFYSEKELIDSLYNKGLINKKTDKKVKTLKRNKVKTKMKKIKKCPICGKDDFGEEYIYDGVKMCRSCYWLLKYGVWPG